MLATIIGVIALLYGWYNYLRKNYTPTLMVLFFFQTKFYQLSIFGESLINNAFSWVYSFVIIFWGASKHKNYFSIRNDVIAKCIVLLELYVLISLVITVLFGVEDFSHAFRVYRGYFFFIFYFWLRRIPYQNYVSCCKYLIFITLILTILFYSQLFGVELLVGRENGISSDDDRLGNYPYLIVFLFLFFVFSSINKGPKFISILFVAGALALSQHRGVILSLLLASIIGMMIRGKISALVNYGVIMATAFVLFAPIFAERFATLNVRNEVSEASTYGTANRQSVGDMTFAFRLYLIYERFEYMTSNSGRFLFGDGLIDEGSEKCLRKYNFNIGSANLDESGRLVSQQIETSDVAFLPDFMRCGIAYIALLFYMFYSLLVFLYKGRKNEPFVAIIGFTFISYCLLRSLSGDEFTSLSYIIFFSLYIVLSQKLQINIKK